MKKAGKAQGEVFHSWAGGLGGKETPATVAPTMQSLGLGARVLSFFFAGFLALIYLFTQLGEARLFQGWSYTINLAFANAGGLKPGSAVEIAGVPVGQVTAIHLDEKRARVVLQIQSWVQIQDDAIASIQTKGLLGERYITISPGGSDHLIQPGGMLRETESPLDLPGLLSVYVNTLQKNKKPAPPSEQFDLSLE
jgi:phospholipid/cholesterol/gamma-HCH transport system substrate-binding protein